MDIARARVLGGIEQEIKGILGFFKRKIRRNRDGLGRKMEA